MTNPYSVLGLRPNASPDEVRSAFRRLVKTYHPDMSRGDATAGARMAEINAAYDRLQTNVQTQNGAATEVNAPSYLRLMTDAEREALIACADAERRALSSNRPLSRLRFLGKTGPEQDVAIVTLASIRADRKLMRLAFDGAPATEMQLVMPQMHWTTDFKMRCSVDPPRIVPLNLDAPAPRVDVLDGNAFVSGYDGTLRLTFSA